MKSLQKIVFPTHCSCSSRAWCLSVLQVPIKNIERELICPICKELFTHPLILPCQHSVCHKCVKELLMLNQDDSFSTDAGSECSNPGSPRSRVPSPSMERLDRLVRSGASQLWVSAATSLVVCYAIENARKACEFVTFFDLWVPSSSMWNLG